MRVVAVLTGLLSLSLLLPPPTAAASTPAADATDRSAPVVKSVTRAYGEAAVRQAFPAQRVEVRFRGRSGDRVQLRVRRHQECMRVRLLHGTNRLTPDRSGFTRLRRSGWHRFTFRPCADADRRHRLQLTRLRVTPLGLDAGRVRVAVERGYADALRLRVPDDGLALVRRLRGTGRGISAVLPPAGGLVPIRGSYPQGPDLRQPLFLRAGRPLEDVYGARGTGMGDARDPLAGGDRLLVFPAGPSVWRASSPVTHDAVVDGDAVPLATGGVRGRPQELVLAGTAGQWVRLADANGEDDAWLGDEHRELLAPDGRRVPPALPGLWRLPADGRYRLTLTPQGPVTGGSEVRLRSARQIAPVVADGSPQPLATAEPGEWLVAPVELSADHHTYDLEATDVAMSGPWSLHLTPVHGNYCGGRPPTPNGCADFQSAISSENPRSTLWTEGTPYVAVLAAAADTEGQLSLRIGPRD